MNVCGLKPLITAWDSLLQRLQDAKPEIRPGSARRPCLGVHLPRAVSGFLSHWGLSPAVDGQWCPRWPTQNPVQSSCGLVTPHTPAPSPSAPLPPEGCGARRPRQSARRALHLIPSKAAPTETTPPPTIPAPNWRLVPLRILHVRRPGHGLNYKLPAHQVETFFLQKRAEVGAMGHCEVVYDLKKLEATCVPRVRGLINKDGTSLPGEHQAATKRKGRALCSRTWKPACPLRPV